MNSRNARTIAAVVETRRDAGDDIASKNTPNSAIPPPEHHEQDAPREAVGVSRAICAAVQLGPDRTKALLTRLRQQAAEKLTT
jgi:hypothetical protein